jgi:hypothetical protein
MYAWLPDWRSDQGPGSLSAGMSAMGRKVTIGGRSLTGQKRTRIRARVLVLPSGAAIGMATGLQSG